tara:strand:- start:627 stop:1367 length:741 start_codon:yes stop_codon:yes gene_type:complete
MPQGTGPRIVSKLIERVQLRWNDTLSPKSSLIVTTGSRHTGWTLINADTQQPSIQWTGYIDLAGYKPDDLVLVPEVVECQFGSPFFTSAIESEGSPSVSYAVPGGDMVMQIAMSTDKIDDLNFGTGGFLEPLAGFISDNSEFEQIVYNRTLAMGPNQSGVGMHVYQDHISGDRIPVVTTRIYIAIRVAFQPRLRDVAGSRTLLETNWSIPPMRLVIYGQAAEVEDHQLLMLMKRQVDLQQSPDVDV